MNAVKWILALAVGGFLLFMGAMKFTGEAHIFPYIEYKAVTQGLPFAELAFPEGNLATGALEVLAGLLVIFPSTREFGAKLAVLPFLGAVAFHLSPALGVVTPSGYADAKPIAALAAGGPFDQSHFATTESSVLFMIAAGGLVATILNLIIQRNT